jgi:hypothetical protein
MRNETRPVIFTRHAQDRMVLRNVIESEAEAIVRAGSWQPDGIKAWLAFGRVPDGREIAVAFIEYPDRLVVKTVMD